MTLTQSSHPRRKQQDQQMATPAAPTPATAPAGAPAAPAAPAAPKRGRPFVKSGATGLRGKCWWLMRELSTFTINSLLETYATGAEKNAHDNVGQYLERLESCGVVERLERRQPGEALTSPGYVVWRLKRNLGVLAPVWRRDQKVLWDPNRCEVVKPIQKEQPPVLSEANSND